MEDFCQMTKTVVPGIWVVLTNSLLHEYHFSSMEPRSLPENVFSSLSETVGNPVYRLSVHNPVSYIFVEHINGAKYNLMVYAPALAPLLLALSVCEVVPILCQIDENPLRTNQLEVAGMYNNLFDYCDSTSSFPAGEHNVLDTAVLSHHLLHLYVWIRDNEKILIETREGGGGYREFTDTTSGITIYKNRDAVFRPQKKMLESSKYNVRQKYYDSIDSKMEGGEDVD